MKRLQSLDSICRELGGQCIYFDPKKKWTLNDAKAFVKQYWPQQHGDGLTVFKFLDGTTTILFGYLEVAESNITEDINQVMIELKGSYIAYDYYNSEIRMCNDGTTTMTIYLYKAGGANIY